MYYTQSTVCQGGFSNKFLISSSWAYAGFAKGGQLFVVVYFCNAYKTDIFGGGGVACDALRSHAFARGVWGHASPKIFFEWCKLVRFGAYFHNFFLH